MKNRHSLFLRLLVIFGLTFAGLFGAIGAGLRIARPERPSEFMRVNLQTYAAYLAAEIGDPPSRERARAIHERTGLEIWIDSPSLQWRTTEGEPRRHAMQTNLGQSHFRFSGPWGWPQADNPKAGIALTAFLVLLTVLASLHAVRVTFRPIEWIKDATRHYSAGDWAARVPVKGTAELSQLSQLINTMAEKISGHFSAMRGLLAAVSHELRSPLARLRIGLESVGDESVRNQLIEEIHLLDRMTESILNSERARLQSEKLHAQSVELGKWIKEIAKPFGAAVQVTAPQEKITRAIDPDQMALALRSILNNAVTHGGASATQPMKLTLSPSSIVIEDHGPGMSESTLAHLGEPFFQGATSRPHDKTGFGFGLSVSKSILSAHGWSWKVSSQPGQGTRFEILFAKI